VTRTAVRSLRIVSGLTALIVIAWATGCGDAPGTPPTTSPPTPTASPTHWSWSGWTTIGASVEHRPILMMSFGNGAMPVLVVGGVHGDEYGSSAALAFATYLDGHPSAIPAGCRIDVIWCLDPDGRAHDWRGNAHRVDLNRNMPTSDWRSVLLPGDGSARLGLNGGSAPASEPETRALLAVLQTGYRAVISLHSPGGFIDFDGPGGATLAAIMAQASHLPVGHVGYQSSITGSMGEYVPARYHIPLLTIELRSPKLSPGIARALLSVAGLEGARIPTV
jgi:protein MpaA